MFKIGDEVKFTNIGASGLVRDYCSWLDHPSRIDGHCRLADDYKSGLIVDTFIYHGNEYFVVKYKGQDRGKFVQLGFLPESLELVRSAALKVTFDI